LPPGKLGLDGPGRTSRRGKVRGRLLGTLMGALLAAGGEEILQSLGQATS
jgi:hypothetical protein